jgi:hypothetical protein
MEALILQMEKRLERLEHALMETTTQLCQLQTTNKDEKELEIVYQKYLEDKLGSSHSKNVYGVCDIETQDSIIEIKNWRSYKHALGQILCYHDGLDNKKRKVVYLFGKKPKKLKEALLPSKVLY